MAEGFVPRRTRQMVVTAQFVSGMTSYHNAYADNISLKLQGNVGGLVSPGLTRTAATIPPLDHVYVVMMENINYADVIRTKGRSVEVDASMPFLASLAKRGVTLSNMWANYHPSDQNYVAMVAGDTYKYGQTHFPDYNLPVNHLGDLLEARSKTWRAYVQNMKTPCSLVADVDVFMHPVISHSCIFKTCSTTPKDVLKRHGI
jgi:hypothetical protein